MCTKFANMWFKIRWWRHSGSRFLCRSCGYISNKLVLIKNGNQRDVNIALLKLTNHVLCTLPRWDGALLTEHFVAIKHVMMQIRCSAMCWTIFGHLYVETSCRSNITSNKHVELSTLKWARSTEHVLGSRRVQLFNVLMLNTDLRHEIWFSIYCTEHMAL